MSTQSSICITNADSLRRWSDRTIEQFRGSSREGTREIVAVEQEQKRGKPVVHEKTRCEAKDHNTRDPDTKR